jgi:hypothetical protein
MANEGFDFDGFGPFFPGKAKKKNPSGDENHKGKNDPDPGAVTKEAYHGDSFFKV